MCAKEAETTAKVEAHARLCSLINGSARVLSSSWFFLLTRGEGVTTPPTTAASGGEAGSDATTTTVPVGAVRRLARSCGIIRSSAGGGPTLAQADVQLRRNAVGKGRLGY
ncbi:unnamed protein product, partial [Laminaria digitata]